MHSDPQFPWRVNTLGDSQSVQSYAPGPEHDLQDDYKIFYLIFFFYTAVLTSLSYRI